MSAHLAARVFARSLTEQEAAQRYCDRVREWFEHDVARLKELYAIFDPHAGRAPCAVAAEE
ncbi:MAG TPA: hypothetical protein VER76_15570 [Pyrinomonadaceae bacterium]|nr:hypothetical protein [Pyrinomonadaceae bacterium]